MLTAGGSGANVAAATWGSAFVKVFSNGPAPNGALTAEDVQPTSDGGHIVLALARSASSWAKVYNDGFSNSSISRIRQTSDGGYVAVAALREEGPALGRPLVDRIQGSRIHHLKELRPGSAARSEIRVLFAFDPTRSALLLLGGDKAGNWQRWYKENIPIAEQLYLDYTTEPEE